MISHDLLDSRVWFTCEKCKGLGVVKGVQETDESKINLVISTLPNCHYFDSGSVPAGSFFVIPVENARLWN